MKWLIGKRLNNISVWMVYFYIGRSVDRSAHLKELLSKPRPVALYVLSGIFGAASRDMTLLAALMTCNVIHV